MAVQMLGIKTKFTDDQGRPLVGGKVHAYFAGTTTYQDTFKDPDMTIVNTNPIILDDSGSADVYLNGSYRIRIFDKNDVLIEEQDGVTQSASGEITTAKGEIIGLYGAVLNSLTNEVKRAVAAEKTIADSLTSETTRAKSAESALQSSISDETTRAKAAESDLNTGLSKEVSDRESEVTRLDEADAVLQAQINSVGGGKLAYKTYAEMIADKSNIAAKSSIDIIADTDDKNGTYLYDGANFVKSKYDLEKLIRAKVQNTFGTYAQMVTSDLSDGSYALVADDTADKNGIYIKEGGAWVKSKYNMQEAVTKALSTALAYTDSKLLDVFDYSINLVDPAKTTTGWLVTPSGVVEQSKTGNYNLTDFIRVDSGGVYTSYRNSMQTEVATAFYFAAYYDASKQFLRRVNLPNKTGLGKVYNLITIPEDVYYVRLMTNAGAITQFDRMFYKGSEQVEYEHYEKPTLNKDILKDILKLFEDASTSSDLISEVIHPGINLVNPETAQRGCVISSDGSVKTDGVDNYSTSDYIGVVSGETYTGYRNAIGTAGVRSYIFIAYYDINKKFIRREGFPLDGSESLGELYNSLVIPEGVKYIRLMSNSGTIDQFNRMFYKGSEQKEYAPYHYPTLTNILLGDDVAEQVKELSPIKPYLTQSKNLFNYNDAERGFAIGPDGTINTSTDYSVGGFIAVKPDTKYTMQSVKDGTDAFIHTAFYDKDKQFIRRDDTWTRDSDDGSLTITTPSNAYFVRFNINRGVASAKDRMFYEGSEKVPYEEYGATLSGLKIEGVSSNSSNSSSITYQYDMQIPSLYQTDKVWSGYRADHYRQPHTNVYAKFDALQQAYPDYITKQVLGDDDWGNTIACYHFKPNRLPIPSEAKVKNPKVFINCGTHGFEHMPPLATYLMMKELAESWESNPALELLRHNVDFLIIPVANPSGWDDYTRKNRNGVDINRSFPPDFGWQSTNPSSSYYGGAKPLQEKESQYINQVLLENEDIDICLDFHNFHGEAGRDYYIWFSTANPEMERVGQLLSNKMTRVWRKDFDWMPSNYNWNVGLVNNGAGGATIKSQATSLGVPFTATLEICERWWLNPKAVTYDEIHCKTAVETIVNTLLLLLDNLKSNS